MSLSPDGAMTPEDIHRAEERCRFWLDRAIGEGFGAGHGEITRDMKIRIEHNMVGAMAEVAYAKHFGVPLPDDNEFGLGDFGSYQIRGTRHWRGHLIVFENEPIVGRVFVLVVVNSTAYRIAGQIQGRDVVGVGVPPGNRVRKGSPAQLWVAQEDLQPHRGPL